MYGELLAALAADYADGGVTRHLVQGRSTKPVHDAIPLRMVGTLHRIVLEGNDDELALHYPSTGGVFGPDSTRIILESLVRHQDDIRRGLAQQVQTNEVGRSVVHLSLSRWLGLQGYSEFTFREVGASAGLNLHFDEFFADTGDTTLGDASSTVRFDRNWFVQGPPDGRSAQCVDRAGCDPYPIDISDQNQAIRLKSFVWPDQSERFDRITNAISVAQRSPISIVRMSGDEWLNDVLELHGSMPTVVFHSIVWQYLDSAVRDGLRAALHGASKRSSRTAPLIWARMEPAGGLASVDATVYVSHHESHEIHLADVGYHGQNLNWLAPQ